MWPPSDVDAEALILLCRSKKGPSKEDKTALAKAGAAIAAVAAVALGGYFVYKVRRLASVWGAISTGFRLLLCCPCCVACVSLSSSAVTQPAG